MTKQYIVVGILVLMLAGMAMAGKCPYTGAPTPTDYSKVTTLPVEKYVGNLITFSIIDVWKDGHETVAKDRLIIIYYIIDEDVVSESNIYTNSEGKASFTPEDSGRYAVATSHRYLFFDVLARCGDDRCTYGETRISCPDDCALCGDGTCDVDEDKESCPSDCIICGDNSCDSGENRNTCPEDCAHCGDSVCDINENKIGCPEDCVVCGDDVCDYLELESLHETTCPEDCANCGDGYCDFPENATNCAEDCMVCGDNKCEGNENVTCPKDCNVCGDGKCNYDENKTSCAEDCVVCGDDVCDNYELTSLHDTTCPQDCAFCGDGFCDSGESSDCEKDCKSKVEGIFMGYFLIPLLVAIVIVLFEVSRHYVSHKKAIAPVGIARRGAGRFRKASFKKPEVGSLLPYLILFAIGLAISGVLLSMMSLSNNRMFAVFDLGSYLIEAGPAISVIMILLAVGIGLLARATYYTNRSQAIYLSAGFTAAGMLPGLFLFLNLEYLMLMIGVVTGVVVAMMTIKKEEEELSVKKPFKIGSDAADKALFITSLFVCITFFVQVYADAGTADNMSKAIWESKATKGAVRDTFGPQESEQAINNNVVAPFFGSSFGGKLAFAAAAAMLLLVILRLFTLITKLLAGFFAWMLDKSGFV